MLEVTKRCLGLTVDNFTWSLPILSQISDEQLNDLTPTISDIFADVIGYYDMQENSTMEQILEAIQKEVHDQLKLDLGEPELVLSVINLGPLSNEDMAAAENAE